MCVSLCVCISLSVTYLLCQLLKLLRAAQPEQLSQHKTWPDSSTHQLDMSTSNETKREATIFLMVKTIGVRRKQHKPVEDLCFETAVACVLVTWLYLHASSSALTSCTNHLQCFFHFLIVFKIIVLGNTKQHL